MRAKGSRDAPNGQTGNVVKSDLVIIGDPARYEKDLHSAYMVVVTGGDEQGMYLVEKDYLNLGRGALSDIKFTDPHMGRSHAVIFFRETGALFVRDLGSINGTLVNGRRVTEAHLDDGDVIRMAGTTLIVFLVPPSVRRGEAASRHIDFS